MDGVSRRCLEIVGWNAKIVCYSAPTREPIKVNPLGLVAKHVHPPILHVLLGKLPRIPERFAPPRALVVSRQLRRRSPPFIRRDTFEQGSCSCSAGGKVLLDFAMKARRSLQASLSSCTVSMILDRGQSWITKPI